MKLIFKPMRFALAAIFLFYFIPIQASANSQDLADTVWIEPLRFAEFFRDGQLQTDDINNYVAELKRLGFKRIVIAYSTLFRFVLFEDIESSVIRPVDLAYYYFDKPNGQLNLTLINTRVSSGQTSLLGNGGFIIDALVEAAADVDLGGSKINVILGLSSAGDKQLMFDYGYWVTGNQLIADGKVADAEVQFSAMYIDNDIISIESRIAANNAFNQNLADFFIRKFGDKIEGFYLTQEAHCLDQAMSRHWSVIANHVKRTALLEERPLPKIWVSPVISATSCSDQVTLADVIGSYTSQVSLTATPNGEPVGEPLIDVITYQDGAGAASIDGKYWYSYNFNDGTARDERIRRTTQALKSLYEIHQSENALSSFHINIEGWEMDGLCPTGVTGTGVHPYLAYGCPFIGSYSRIKSQIQTYQSELNISANRFMLNEGGLAFDFSSSACADEYIQGFSMKAGYIDFAAKARSFTQQFIHDNPNVSQRCL